MCRIYVESLLVTKCIFLSFCLMEQFDFLNFLYIFLNVKTRVEDLVTWCCYTFFMVLFMHTIFFLLTFENRRIVWFAKPSKFNTV